MSELKRYLLKDEGYADMWMVGEDGSSNREEGPWVLASEFDAAQSELAALREELAEVSGTLEFNTACWGRERAVMIDKQQTLTADLIACGRHRKAAEQRNAILEAGLRDVILKCRESWTQTAIEMFAEEALETALKPTESGASE